MKSAVKETKGKEIVQTRTQTHLVQWETKRKTARERERKRESVNEQKNAKSIIKQQMLLQYY